MRRREFFGVLGGAAVAMPHAARGQQPRIAQIGFLGLVSASSHAARSAALRAGLRDLGWVEGKNLHIDPGLLPIERSTKFTIIVNLKAANALGLTIPPTLLARADEVIE